MGSWFYSTEYVLQTGAICRSDRKAVTFTAFNKV